MKDEVIPSDPSDSHRRDLRERTLEYALRVVRLCSALPKSDPGPILSRQLLKSGTSVGAQYREAFRAKSTADFVSKIGGALGELDESDYWLEVIARSGLISARRLEPLQSETRELLAIFTAASKRAKTRGK